jgi:peptide/nickel transport system substrate-binding protein
MRQVRRARRFGSTAAAVICVLLTSATAQGQSASPSPDDKVVFVVGMTSDLKRANPFRGVVANDAWVSGLMYDGLLRLGQKDYAPQGELADRWVVSEDGLTWTFHIRDGMKWSDGVPITADDFVWTGNFIIENDISSWSDGYRFTESIEAEDDQTIVWTTTRPTLIPGLPGYNMILPKHVWSEFTVQELKSYKNYPDPVVSGPFTLAQWDEGGDWIMDARPDYWQGPPHIDQIVFRKYNSDEAVVQALLRGSIDYTQIATADLFDRIKNEPNIATSIDSAEAFYHMSFNVVEDPASTANPAMRDIRFRQAIEHAIDRQTLIDRVVKGYGTPGSTPIAPVYTYWHWEPPPDERRGYDPVEANRLLDEAGYVDTNGDGTRELPGGGEPMSLRLYAENDDPDGLNAAQFIAGWLEDVGIQVKRSVLAEGRLFDLWYGFDWDMIVYSWGTDPDPDFLLSSFTSNQCGYWSDTCYDNPTYDDMYKQQQTTLDRGERQQVVHEMQQTLYRDTPEIVLWYPNSFEAWRSDRWTGFLHWPEPDGVVFVYNTYSARNVHPLFAGAGATAEGGPPGYAWLIGAGAMGLLLLAAASRRRRLDGYYA